MNGRVVTVKFIDGIGQIHLEESGLALIPGVDEYELLSSEKLYLKINYTYSEWI
jgi:hypothetical protein